MPSDRSPLVVACTMLITGATGFIGSRLATTALARGVTVRTLTRSDWSGEPDVPPEQRFFGDLPGLLPRAAFEGVDVIVHCAAQASGSAEATAAVNVQGTLNLADLAERAGVKTFIFLSSQSARSDAASVYGRSKYAAERALLERTKPRVIVLRPGLVTGEGKSGLYQRLTRTIEHLPIIPLLAGGQSIVQPIHVDDLCDAILRCVNRAESLSQSILCLGDETGMSLATFLKAVALSHTGHAKPLLTIPLWPVEAIVWAAEALRVPVPISSANLQGMKRIQRMETRADLDRLGIQLRPLEAMVQRYPGPMPSRLPVAERAVRAILVGAGRVGLVHAVTLSRLNGLVLVGLVDRNPAATRLLRGIGLATPSYSELVNAIEQTRPDAVVIATPAVTHLPLTRTALEHGLAVMVEKPLAVRAEQLADYEQLSRQYPRCPVQVGYVMLLNPQITRYLKDLRAGRFGKVHGFVGLSLLSLIEGAGSKRWEIRRAVSGGGVFINSGGHILSLIQEAFGEPQVVAAEQTRIFSDEVEDSMVVRYTYEGFSGTQYCSWSIRGFPRQENLLVIWTERGQVLLSGSTGLFIDQNGNVDCAHQLDFDVGFNLAPDYVGAGFTTELSDLRDAVRLGKPGTVSLERAVRLERLLFHIYANARSVSAFNSAPPVDTSITQQTLKPAGGSALPRCLLDLRELSVAAVKAYLQSQPTDAPWVGHLVTPAQISALPAHRQATQRLYVSVPDFSSQSRLLATGRYVDVLRSMGPVGLARATLAASLGLARERGATFWVAALGLLGAGLQAAPASFQGTLLLHGFLVDLALSVRRLELLEEMLTLCRRVRPRARIGFHTNLGAEAANALPLLATRVDCVSVLTSPAAHAIAPVMRDLRGTSERPRELLAEVGLAPPQLHLSAALTPEAWAHGADAVVIGAIADPMLATQRRQELNQAWGEAFPGLILPEGIF